MNEAFAGSAIEELDGRDRVLSARGGVRLLERGAKRGALCAVARHSGSGLTHVLFRGRDIRHCLISKFSDTTGAILLFPANLACKDNRDLEQ